LGDVSFNATSMAVLMEQCQCLKALTLQNVEFLDEDQIRVLGAYSRPGIDIALSHCTLTSAGASALAEVLGRNQGPTKLDYCFIDNFVLANELRGKSRLISLSLRFSRSLEVSNRELLVTASALKENEGLVDFNTHEFRMSDETWYEVCESLKTHVLDLFSVRAQEGAPLSPMVLKSRIQTLVDMLKLNTSMHTICARDCYSKYQLSRKSVIPHLETNQFRPRLLAIQKTRLITYRATMLGRALLAVRADANSFWMLLSGNPEVAFPSATTTIAAATDLPTPTPTAATATSNAAAIAASVMPALTTTATGSLPRAAEAAARSDTNPSTASALDPTVATANVAVSIAGQKRKARP
jgi:hypothetical protein